jgi:hypothetical protein
MGHEGTGIYQNSGAVCTNCPTRAGNLGRDENTGACVVSPLGLQKPLVVHPVKGHSMSSSFTSLNILWYCR